MNGMWDGYKGIFMGKSYKIHIEHIVEANLGWGEY